MRSLQFSFASPAAWLLLAGVLLALVALAVRERDGRKRLLRAVRWPGAILSLQTVALIAGLVLAFRPLIAGQENIWEGGQLPLGLSLLALAALLATLVLPRAAARPALRFSSVEAVAKLPAASPPRWRYLAPALRLVALAAVVAALARPQVASTEADVFTEGMDIVLTLDVSTSMEAVDFAPPSRHGERLNRINGAKEVIAHFIKQRSNDRLGLVVFAAEAFTQCPLTLDYSVLLNILRDVRTGAIEDGTAIGDAVLVAINRLEHSEAKSKVIILVTDGDDNASRIAPRQAAQIAAEKKIIIFPILVGKGGKVPYPIGKDMFGAVQYGQVEIRTNPELLKDMAQTTRGKFYQATDEQALAEDLQDILDHMEKTRLLDPGRFTRYTEVFQLPLLAALLALVLELSLRWTRLRSFP